MKASAVILGFVAAAMSGSVLCASAEIAVRVEPCAATPALEWEFPGGKPDQVHTEIWNGERWARSSTYSRKALGDSRELTGVDSEGSETGKPLLLERSRIYRVVGCSTRFGDCETSQVVWSPAYVCRADRTPEAIEAIQTVVDIEIGDRIEEFGTSGSIDNQIIQHNVYLALKAYYSLGDYRHSEEHEMKLPPIIEDHYKAPFLHHVLMSVWWVWEEHRRIPEGMVSIWSWFDRFKSSSPARPPEKIARPFKGVREIKLQGTERPGSEAPELRFVGRVLIEVQEEWDDERNVPLRPDTIGLINRLSIYEKHEETGPGFVAEQLRTNVGPVIVFPDMHEIVFVWLAEEFKSFDEAVDWILAGELVKEGKLGGAFLQKVDSYRLTSRDPKR